MNSVNQRKGERVNSFIQKGKSWDDHSIDGESKLLRKSIDI